MTIHDPATITDLFPETVAPHVPGPRRWVPADWIDEITPPGREHPTEWISWAVGEATVRIAWGDDEPEIFRDVAPGECVEFGWSVDHGRVTFTIRPDGTYTTSRPIPPEVNSFWQIGEPDTWGDSADEFARNMAGLQWDCPGCAEDDAEIEIDVCMGQWNHEKEIFVLAIDPEGAPRFLPAAGAITELAALRERRDQLLTANNTYLERARAAEQRFDLIAHLKRQAAFSLETFGPGARTAGVVDHIRKELTEIEADPADVMEWVDVIILAFDGAWRAGWTAEDIVTAIVAKQTRNEARTWPDWRTAAPDKAIEHVREGAHHG